MDSAKPSRVLVLAGSYGQFRHWCLENHVSPTDSDRVRYISSVRTLQGARHYDFVRYGTWFERTDLEDIEDQQLMNEMADKARRPESKPSA